MRELIAVAMTCSKSSAIPSRRRAATLLRPTGGKTPRGRGLSGTALAWGVWPQSGLSVGLAERQIAVRQHYHGQVAVEALSETPFVLVETELARGVMVEALHDPPYVRQLDQAFAVEVVQAPGEEILHLIAPERGFRHQPAAAGDRLAAIAAPPNAHAGGLLDQRSTASRLSERRTSSAKGSG